MTIERSAPAGKCGKICSCQDKAGRKERRSLNVCEEVTVSPFGMRTVIGLVAIFRLMCGVVMETQWLVLLDSAIRSEEFYD